GSRPSKRYAVNGCRISYDYNSNPTLIEGIMGKTDRIFHFPSLNSTEYGFFRKYALYTLRLNQYFFPVLSDTRSRRRPISKRWYAGRRSLLIPGYIWYVSVPVNGSLGTSSLDQVIGRPVRYTHCADSRYSGLI